MHDIREAGRLIQKARRSAKLTQRDLADLVGTSQPAVATVEQNLTNPTVATLARLAAAAGFAISIELVPLPAVDPVVERYKQDVDRTLLRENLKRSIDTRLRTLSDWQAAGRELQQATHRAAQHARRRK